MFRDAMKGQEGGDKRSRDATTRNNITGEEAVTGTSKAYTLSRLQKVNQEGTKKPMTMSSVTLLPM
jgi:hypothetical protein